MQIVKLLNQINALFESVIEKYDVYKTDVIGDGCMVVSGFPIRNGNYYPPIGGEKTI